MWKKGDLAYYVTEYHQEDHSDPIVCSVEVVRANNKQLVIALAGPDGHVRFGMVHGVPKLHYNGRTKLFPTPIEALVDYHGQAHVIVEQKRDALRAAQRRAAWASDKLAQALDELRRIS